MFERTTRGAVLSGALAVALLCVTAVAQANDVFDASGFNRNRDFFSQLPFEHIDPLTGNLLLTFTDLVLPGNAGFDLRVQRTYNSKIYRNYAKEGEALHEDSWAGVGWTLHLGRVFHWDPLDTAAPIVEMPDGSRHSTYEHVDSSGRYISRDFWVYSKNDHTLKLPNGVVYTFGHLTSISGVPSPTVAYATRIQDPFGNHIDIHYWNQIGATGCQASNAPNDGICTITQYVGSRTRQVTFTYEPNWKSVATMTYQGDDTHTWTYTSAGTENYGYSLLTQVEPPVGTPWQYEYNDTYPFQYELTKLTTPNGGTISYTYKERSFYLGTNEPIPSVVVASRTIGGRDVAAGTWTYEYAKGAAENQSVFTAAPCGTTTTYTFFGVGDPTTAGPAWRVGLLASRSVAQGATVLTTETTTWRTPAFADRISDDNEVVDANQSYEIYVPLVQARAATLGGRTYTTTYTYGTSLFNDYGRPKQIDEEGELSRTTTQTFWYGSDPTVYIVDRPLTETVTDGSEAFTKSWTWQAANGFKTSETIYGITTTFTPDGYGNVQSAKDANAHTTSFTYDYGVVKNTVTPEHTIQRGINPEGLVVSETRRGYTTYSAYDAALRRTSVTPPAGNPVTFVYDNALGAWSNTLRGVSRVTTYLDGFGRVTGTANAQSVSTNINYDACGRKCLESLPYNTSYPERDIQYSYDGLNRMTRRTNPDASYVQYAYSGIDVTITDEESKKSFQDWSAFGDPGSARLTAVFEAYGTVSQQTTTYTYNTLGNLTRVTHPTGGGMTSTLTRTWAYYGPSESGGTPGLLKSETHPESATVTYTYWPAGNLKTRTDAQFGTTTYTYDNNNRVTNVNHPGSTYDTTISWDASDNRTGLANSYVATTLAFDGANRLTGRRDVVSGKTFDTIYKPDGNDNIEKITYPSTRQVAYTYDTANRIATVKNGITNAAYAQTFTYHPSGQPLSFTAGNGIVHQFTYEANTHRLSTLTEGAASLKLGYSYDKVGNVKTITDTTTGRSGMNQSFTYDEFDRLKTATGFWTGGSLALTYDSVGNMRTTSIGGTTVFGYDNSHNRIASASGAYGDAFGYDANGNLISNAVGTYTFTSENMVETATVAGAITTYRYDGENYRSLKTTAGTNHYFVHGPGGMLLGEYTDSGCATGTITLRDYVYAGTRLLATVSSLPEVSVTGTAATVVEDGGAVTVGVRITTPDNCPLATDVTVAYSTANLTALAGSDYTAIGGTVTFAKGTATGSVQNVVVPILNDGIIESSETFQLALASPSGAVLGTSAETITIQDNDTPILALSSITSAVKEDGTWVGTPPTVAVTTDDGIPLPGAVTVKYATSNGTAVATADYTAKTGTLSFSAGAASGTSQSISVAIVQDALAEADETFKVTLSTPLGGTIAAGQNVDTVTIQDDEPTVALAASTATVVEGGGTASFAVVLTTRPGFPTTTSPVTVKYATANGTAVAPADYTVTTGVLTFPAGSNSGDTRTASVPIVRDSLVEADETFKVSLSAPGGARIGTPASQTITIQDDSPSVALTASTATIVESGGAVSFGVVLTTRPGFPTATVGPVTVKYATANATALAGNDYAVTSGVLTFPAGTKTGSTRAASVPVLRDALVEANETFKITLSGPVGVWLDTPASETVTIQDDTPTVAFTSATSSIMESEHAVVSVTLTTKAGAATTTGGDVTVKYATANGTAVAPGDYTVTTGTLTFPAGTASGAVQNITVPVVDDAVSEKSETFTVTLSAPVGTALGSIKTHTATVQDNDTPTITLLPFVSNSTTSGENVGKATVTIQVTTTAGNPLSGLATVKYATAAGAAPAATANVDFTAVAGALTFPVGTPSGTTKTIDVAITQDALAESDENLTFSLSTPTSAALGTSSVVMQIIDDEPTVEFAAPTASMVEGWYPDRWPGFSVQLKTRPGFPTTTAGPVTVKYATANGTALAGSDYTATSGVLTFPAGSASNDVKYIYVSTLSDQLKENEEAFTVRLSAPTGARLGTASLLTVTIQDDDAPTVSLVSFVSSPATSGEYVGKATVTVEVKQLPPGNTVFPTSAPVTVKYATSAGAAPAATAGTDFVAAAGIMTFTAGTVGGATQSVDIVIKQDALAESDENLKFYLYTPVGASLATSSSTVIQIIDDEPTVEFTAATGWVLETGGPATVPVKLTTRPGLPTTTAGAVTVKYATANGTALAGSDYTATSGVLTFPAGTANETVQNINVPIVRNSIAEKDETFTVSAYAPVGARLGTVKLHTVTISETVPLAARIDTVPYVITAAGDYVLGRDLGSDLAQGAAIAIEADAVTLDLAGYSLTNKAGADSEAVGILGVGRQDVTVRNGTVRGFATAVKLVEGETLRVEDVLALESRSTGLEVCGEHSRIERNRVVDTGAGETAARGLMACGPGVRVTDNDVFDGAGNESRGIEVRAADGAQISANRVGVSRGVLGVGIAVVDSAGVTVTSNRVTGTIRGIVLDRSEGSCSENVTSGVEEIGDCAEVER